VNGACVQELELRHLCYHVCFFWRSRVTEVAYVKQEGNIIIDRTEKERERAITLQMEVGQEGEERERGRERGGGKRRIC
jgi:hypothetical protein